MTRAINAAGIGLVQSFEECKLTSYPDINGIWTVGWGHTGPDVTPTTVWTQVMADHWLEINLNDAADIVEKNVTCPLNDNQFAALVSFVYNVGPGNPAKGKDGFVRLANGKPSSMLRALNRGDYAAAAIEFPKWNKASGNPVAGLTRRRQAEQALFRTPITDNIET